MYEWTALVHVGLIGPFSWSEFFPQHAEGSFFKEGERFFFVCFAATEALVLFFFSFCHRWEEVEDLMRKMAVIG